MNFYILRKTLSKVKAALDAANELADAAGRVINNTGLANLQSAICDLNLKMVKYDQAVDAMKKITCGSCPLPCEQDWCSTKEN